MFASTGLFFASWQVAAYIRPDLYIPQIPENEFFLGRFLSEPVNACQTNMWKVYETLGLPTNLINQNVSLRISRTIPESEKSPSHYWFRLEAHSPETPLKLVFHFEPGSTNETTLMGRPITVKTEIIGRDLSLHYNLDGIGQVQERYHFKVVPEFDGIIVNYVLPNGVRGKRTFLRLKRKVDFSRLSSTVGQ